VLQAAQDDVSDGAGIHSRDGTRTPGPNTSRSPCHQETVGPSTCCGIFCHNLLSAKAALVLYGFVETDLVYLFAYSFI